MLLLIRIIKLCFFNLEKDSEIAGANSIKHFKSLEKPENSP
jgi:hypothetical protein